MKSRGPHSRRQARGPAHWRPGSLVVAVSAAFGAPALAEVTAVGGGPTTVGSFTPSGSYTTGYDVTTSLVRNSVGLNRFSEFDVDAASHVRLHLPGSADSLVNLIESAGRAEVHGLVQGIQGGSAVGGNLYFASPAGFLVGATGSIEAGSLTITTPTQGFVDDFIADFDATGPAVSRMLSGDFPLSVEPIEIHGRLTAENSVLLYSRGVTVSGASAEITIAGTPEARGEELFQRLVNTDGFLAGSAIAETAGGALVIVAERDGVLVGPGATLDAGGGGLIVTAADFQRPSDSTDIDDWFRPSRTAMANVEIDGVLRGGEVTIVAAAEAVTEWQTPLDALEDLAPELVQLMGDATSELRQNLPALDGAVAIANADARVVIGASARIESAGDVRLEAHAHRSATAEASAEDGAWLGAAAAYGRLSGETRVEVEEGATIVAPGTLALLAASENALTVSAVSSANQGTAVSLAGTAAVSEVDVSTVAILNAGQSGGVDLVDVDRIEISALSDNSYSTEASATADGGLAIGLAAAVSLIESETRATLSGSLELGSGLAILAHSRTGTLNVVAATGAGTDAPGGGDDEGEAPEDKLGSWIETLLGGASDDVAADSAGSDTPASGGDGGLPLKIGSAVAYLDARETTVAEVADGTRINPRPDPTPTPNAGDVTVVSRRELDGFRNHAASATASQGESSAGESSGTSVSISAAVALAFVEHGAHARVGDGVEIRAARLGLAAELLQQPNAEWGEDDGFTGIDDFGGEDGDTGSLNSWASAGIEGSDTVAISGAVAYLDLDGSAIATVGNRTVLGADEADGDWSTALGAGAEDPEIEWGGALSILANADVRTVDLAGNTSGSGKVGIGGAVAWIDRSTTAQVLVGHDGELISAGDVRIAARRRDDFIVLAPVAGTGAGADSLVSLNAAVAYGRFRGLTEAGLGHGSAVDAGGGFGLSADTEFTGEVVTVSTLKDGGTFALAGTVAYADLSQSTLAVRGEAYASGYTPALGAQSRIAAAGVIVAATQKADYKVSAKGTAESRVAVGLAGAVADIASDTHAGLASTVASDGDVIVLADSRTGTKAVSAETSAKAPTEEEQEEEEVPGDVADDGTNATGFTQARSDAADGKTSDSVDASGSGSPGSTPGGGGGGSSLNLRLSGAVVVALSEESARATVADDSSIGSAVDRAGDVVIVARRREEGFTTRVKSATEAKVKDSGGGGGTGIAVGAAVSYAELDNRASALVGSGVSIHSERIGIGSLVSLPDHFRTPALDDLPDFSEVEDLASFTDAAVEATEEFIESWFTTYVSATAVSQNSTVDFAGAVNILFLDNLSEAWVGDGATLDASGAGADWDYVIAPADGENDEDAWTFGETVTVAASTDVSTIDLAGNLAGLTGFGVDASGTTAAIGGAFLWSERSNTTVAGLGADVTVVVPAGALRVQADASDRAISLAPTSGRGADFAINGTVAVTRTDHLTSASLHNSADVTAGAIGVLATQDLTVWSVAGAVAIGRNLGVGLGTAVNDLSTRTVALIGDNGEYRPADLDGVPGAGLGAGDIRTDALNVEAVTRGLVGTAAVAGSSSGGTQSPGGGSAQGGSDSARSGFDDRTETVQTDADQQSADQSMEEPANSLVSGQSDGGQSLNGSGSSSKSNSQFSLAISGSAAVNLTELDTDAVIDGADIAGNGGDVTVSVRALNDTDQLALAGAGALARSAPGGSGPTVAIAGAIAINQLDNDTQARVLDSDIIGVAGADGLSVEAMTAGELIGVGLGLAITNSTGGSTSVSVAGSVSLGMLRNETIAEIDGSTIEGDGGDEAVRVVAYDRSRIASGGGALTFGGRAGVGVAVSYADIGNTTRASVTDSDITDFSALDIGAFSAARIISAAVGLQASTDAQQGFGIAGSVAVNLIHNDVLAELGESDVDVSGAVTVQAASVSGTDFATLLAGLDGSARAGGRHDVNWSGENSEVTGQGGAREDNGLDSGDHENQGAIDAKYSEFVSDASLGGVLDGEAILGIAGNIQVSKSQNSIGLAFTGNFIDNVYEAVIRDSEVNADTVTVDAVQSARILGIAAGAALTNGKFAGLGSGVANVIGLNDGSVSAVLSGSTVEADDIAVRGLNRSRIDAAAGNVAYSSKASFGAAVGYNEIETETSALVTNSTLRGRAGGAADSLDVAALTTGDIYALAVAGAASQGVALAGSVNINRLNQAVDAGISGGTVNVADVDVSAGNATSGAAAEIWTLTGSVGISLGSAAAAGAAFAWNEVGNDYTAVVTGTSFNGLSALNVDAGTSGKIRTLTAAGAFTTGQLAITGAGSYSVVDATADARIENAAVDMSGANISVRAADDADIASIAASLAVSTGSAAGAGAVAVNEIDNKVTAEVLGGAIETGSLLVDAISDTEILTIAAGIAGTAGVGVAGSAAVNMVDTVLLARIAEGAMVDAAGDVGVRARSTDEIQLIAGSLGIGAGALGAAATVAVNMLGGSTTALIGAGLDNDGNPLADGTEVTALGGSGIVIGTGDLDGQRGLIDYGTPGGNAGGNSSGTDEAALSSAYIAARLAEGQETVRGVAVSAGSLQSVASYIATVGINPNVKSGVALAGTVNVNLLERETIAAVRNATVETVNVAGTGGADLTVRASAHAETRSLAIGAALSSVGAAAAVATDVFDRTTVAELIGAEVRAFGDVTVDAYTSQTANAMAFGAAVGTWTGVAGGGVLMLMEGENAARVAGGSVEADSLIVTAEYRNVLNLTTANAAVSGGVAAAGSFAVGVVESTNIAEVVGADIDVNDDLVAAADTWNELHTIAASGAASAGASIAGMASVSIIGSETYAYLDNSAVHAGDLVRVSASDSLASRSYGGGVSLGYGAALGAAATVIVGRSTVDAASLNSDVDAGAMQVLADRKADVEAYTITAAISGSIGIGAGVGVILLGGNGVAGVDTVDDPEAGSQRSLSDELDNGNGSTLNELDDFGGGQLTEGSGSGTYGNIGLSDERRSRVSGATSYEVGSTMRTGGEHATRARIAGGTLTLGSLDVDAAEGNRTINAGGALAVGLAGVGGAAAVTHVNSVVEASVNGDITLTGAAGMNVNAESGAIAALIASPFNLNRYINNAGSSIGSAIGGDNVGDRTVLVLAAAGAGGIVGMGAAYADGRAASSVTASLGGELSRSAAAPVNVSASDGNSIGSYGIGAAVGAAAAGLVVGFGEKSSVVTAQIGSNADIDGPGALALSATAGGVVTARGAAAAGGLLFAGSGSVIIASDSVTARTSIGADVRIDDASAVTLTASATPRTDVKAFAGALGGVSIGVSYAEARANARAESLIGDRTVFGGATGPVTLTASTAPASGYAADAEAFAAGGGFLFSANGAIANARDNTVALARVGDDVLFESGGNVTVNSRARPAARAVGQGYSGAGVAAFGVALADARASASARSLVGHGVALAGNGNLTLDALVTTSGAIINSARAESTTGAGAGLVGAVGARATATTTTLAEARTGAELTLAGDTRIEARNETSQFARGTGRAGAAIAIGVVDVDAVSNTTTLAVLGHSAQAAGGRAGNITIRANGLNTDRAQAVSGTGGVIAGSAAEATTTSTGNARAEISECTDDGCPTAAGDRVTLRAGRVSVEARHANDFYGSVNSRSAHLAGASGARTSHLANANATVRVGNSANLDLLFLNLDAQTSSVQPASGNNLDVGAGGALNASAGRAVSTVNANAAVQIGTDAIVRSFRLGSAEGEGDIRMRAYNHLDSYQRGSLDTGGLIDIPQVDVISVANLTGIIDIASGAQVGAAQDLSAVAYSDGDLQAHATVRTHGLAGAARGTTAATLNATHDVLVRSNATLAASRDMLVGAGLDAARGVGTLNVIADTYIWNKTAIPVKTDPNADARLTGSNFINVAAGGLVSAGRDVELVTTWQEYHARGVGIGKDLYREVLQQITNTLVKIFTFGKVKKAVSLEIRRGTSVVGANDGITVNGSVVGGASAYQYLWITDEVDANGDPIVRSSLGVNYRITERDIMQDLMDQLVYYQTLMQQYAEQGSALFWRAYAQAYTITSQIAALQDHVAENGGSADEFIVKAVELEDIETRGGNVVLRTGTLNGSGRISLGDVPNWEDVPNAPVDALTPGSSLSVRLVNEGNAHLYVGDIAMGDSIGNILLHTTTPGFLGGGRYQFTVDLSNSSNWNGVQVSGGGAGVPEVHIVNTYEEAQGELPPDIHLVGNITNRGGLVSVGSTGSIISSGNIEADTVRIAARGSYIQNYTNGFRHLGGVPDGATPPSESQIVAGGAIYISGEYVNINGLVRSGVAEYDLTVTDTLLSNSLSAAPADQNEVYLSGQFSDGMPNLNELRAYYDRERDVIVVRKTEVRPGYIFIFGDVISTGGGRLEAVSGYGDIRLDNQTGKEIVLEGLDVGTGGNGIIEILDMGHAELPSNLPDLDDPADEGVIVEIPSPRRTVYEHDWQTDTMTVSQSYLNAQLSGEDLDVIERPIGSDTVAGRSTTYQPKEGRYWDRQQTVETLTFRLFGITINLGSFPTGEVKEVLTSTPTSTSIAADHPIAINFLGGGAGFLEVSSLGDVSLSGELRNLDGTVTLDTRGALHNPGVLGGIVADRIEVSARSGIGSDLAPLQLEVGAGAAQVVTERGDVYLRGRGSDLLLDHVRSDLGDIHVYSQFDILDAGLHAEAAVRGRSITLESISGNIGAADQLLRIDTGHGSQVEVEDFLARLQLELERLFSGLGFLGFNITLPDLTPPAAQTPVAATLTAAAETGAYIEEVSGDLHVNLVDVRDGDVHLRVSDGSLVNALGRGELDLDRLAELTTLWDDMRLLGSEAAAAAQESVEAYERNVVSQYHEYWHLRGFVEADGATQADLQNVFSARYLDAAYGDILASRLGDAEAAAALLDSLTGDNDLDTLRLRTAYELDRIEGYLETELGVDALSGTAGFDAHDETWIFTLAADDARVAAIVEGAEWTEEELLNSINADALIDVDSTIYELVQPNIVGDKVTIETAGSVGSFDEPIRIELPTDGTDPDSYPELTDQQIAALLAAQPGDISFEGGTFNTATGEFEGDITAIIIGRTLVVGVNVADELAVASGGNAFIVSPFQSLQLDRVEAPGDVRIQVRGDIIAAAHGQPVIVGAAGGLLLEAEDGSIGSALRPIYVNLDDAPFVTARAAEGLYLVSQTGLRIERMNTLAGTLFLKAEDGSIVARDDDLVDLAADDIHLEASGDVTGGSGESGFDGVNVRLGAGGQVSGSAGGAFRVAALEGALHLQDVTSGAETSALALEALSVDTVNAGGDFSATSLEGAIALLNVTSGGDAILLAQDAVDADTVAAGGALNVTSLESTVALRDVSSGGDASALAQGSLTADGMNVGGALDAVSTTGAMLLHEVSSGEDLSALAAGTITADTVAAGGKLRMESQNADIILDRVQAGAAGADAIVISAAGGIRGGLPVDGIGAEGINGLDLDLLHYHLAARGADAEVELLAGGDIGSEDRHLVLVAPVLDAFSGEGSIWITALDTIESGSIDASNGAMALYGRDGLGTDGGMALRVRDGLDLRGNDVRADIVHTGAGALPMSLQRIDGAELDTAELWVDAANGLTIARLYGRDILLETSATRMDIPDARVLGSFEYFVPDAHVYMNNVGAPRHPSADVQLYQPAFDFFLLQDGRFTYTNAYVLYYGAGYEVRVPNYVPDHRDTRRDVDGRAGERQTGAWVSDLSDAERSSRSGEMLIDFKAMLETPDGMAFSAPQDLELLEDSGILSTAFGSPLRDREAIAQRQQRAEALRELVQRLASRNVLFGFDDVNLSDDDRAFLDYVAAVLADQPERRVRIEGYTDALGEMRYNRGLGEARANSVMNYLMERGVRPEQMEIIGIGADYAVADNDTETGRSANRRVEITVLPSETARLH